MSVSKPDYILEMEAKFVILTNMYKNIALNIFEWKGLPKGLTSEYIERKLFEKGSLFFYDSVKAGGLMCLPANNSSNINVYEYPEQVNVVGHNFTEVVNYEDGVLIKNNPLKVPTFQGIAFWLEHLVDIFSAFKVNLNHSKTPYILTGSKEQMLTLKNILQQVTGNSIAITLDKSLAGDIATIDLKQTGVTYLGDKLLDAYDRIEDKLLTFLGINNANTMKRERLVVDEVNSNNDEIENNLDTYFTARKRACDEINKKFGLSISVDLNQNYVERMKEKVSRETHEAMKEENEQGEEDNG